MNVVEVMLVVTKDENGNVSEEQNKYYVKHHKDDDENSQTDLTYYRLVPNEEYFIFERLIFNLDQYNYDKDYIKGFIRGTANTYRDLFTASIIDNILEDIEKRIDKLEI